MGVLSCVRLFKKAGVKDMDNPDMEAALIRHHLVVGVDFGTTNTGVAYSFSSDPNPDKIQIIADWPSVGRGGINETKEKVPSEISYDSNPSTWGYMFKAGEPRLAWFKLLLDPAAGEMQYNDETVDAGNPNATMKLPSGKTVVDVCADYLAIVYNHTMSTLSKRLPGSLQSTPIKFVITTPAMWGVNAQHMTAMAAKKAGFGSRSIDWIDMVSEPEAAAAYALKQLNAENRHTIEEWDEKHALTDEKAGSLTDDDSSMDSSMTNRCVGFNSLSLNEQHDLPTWRPDTQLIVCDAGGGTVDLVAYEITQMVPYLKVNETVQAKGGLCGATALDREFLREVKARLGPHQEHLLTSKKIGRGSVMMAAWETAKRHFSIFSTTQYIEHNIWDIEENEKAGVTDEEFVFTSDDMKAIFDPVLDKIVRLVSDVAASARKEHPKKPVAGVVLVGGFGESPYLFHKVKQWAEDQKPPVFVCNPRDSWAAIAKGAVCYGLEPISDRRILKCHWGVELNVDFDETIHEEKYTFLCPWDDRKMYSNNVKWFAPMGKALERDEMIDVPFQVTRVVPSRTKPQGSVNICLRTCRYSEPPTKRLDPKAVAAPQLTINFADLPDTAFDYRTRKNGKIVARLEGTVKMIVHSASYSFQVRSKRYDQLLAETTFDA